MSSYLSQKFPLLKQLFSAPPFCSSLFSFSIISEMTLIPHSQVHVLSISLIVFLCLIFQYPALQPQSTGRIQGPKLPNQCHLSFHDAKTYPKQTISGISRGGPRLGIERLGPFISLQCFLGIYTREKIMQVVKLSRTEAGSVLYSFYWLHSTEVFARCPIIWQNRISRQ